jgi:hypothetical protein
VTDQQLYYASASKQAALSEFLSDNYSAATRARMFTNQPRTTGLSVRWKF